MTGQPPQASRLREFAGWLQRWAAYFQEQAELAEGRSLDSEPPVAGNAAPESGLPGETPPAGAAGIQSAPGEEHGEPHAPPAHWQELARSAGPPAHWLALFEEDSAGLFSAQNELDDAEAGHQDPAAWFQALQQGTADFLDGGEGLPAVPIGGDPPGPTRPASGEPRLPGAGASAADGSPAPAHTIPRRGEPPMPAQPASGEPRLSDAAASAAGESPASYPTQAPAQAPASATRLSIAPAPSAAPSNWTRLSQAPAAASDGSPASPIPRRGDPPAPTRPPASKLRLSIASAAASNGSPALHPTQAAAQAPPSEARLPAAPSPTATAPPAPASPAQQNLHKVRLHIAAPLPIQSRRPAPALLPVESSMVLKPAPVSLPEMPGMPVEFGASAQPLPVESRQEMPATSPQPESAARTPETAAPPPDQPPAPASRLPESSPPAQPPAAAVLPNPPPEWLWPELPDTWNETPAQPPSLRTLPAGLRRDAHRRQRLDQEQRGRPWNA